MKGKLGLITVVFVAAFALINCGVPEEGYNDNADLYDDSGLEEELEQEMQQE